MAIRPKACVSVQSTSAFIQLLAAGVLLINLFVLGLAGLSLFQDRRQYEERARITSRNLANVLEQYIVGTIQKADLTLLAVGDEFERLAVGGGNNREALDAYIARQHARIPELDGLRMTNAEGIVTYGIGVDPGSQVSVADRDYFIQARNNPQSGMFISRPIFGRISRKWVINFARRCNNLDGSFAGVIYGALPLDYFTKTFSRLDVGPHGRVSLRDGNMGIITRYPVPKDIGAIIGNKTLPPELRTLLDSGQSSGTFFTSGSWDQIDKMVSFGKIANYPLYINVGLAKEDYLAGWRRDVARMSALVAIFSVVTLLLSRMVFIRWKREKQAEEGLRNSKEELEQRVEERTADLLKVNELLHGELGERRRAEDELGKSRNMLAYIMDSVPQAIFWKDRNGAYLGCNRVFARSAGITDPAEIAGKTDYDMPWAHGGAEAYRSDDRSVIESNRARYHIIEVVQQADGNSIWADTTKIPLTDETGRVYGVLGVYEDITEAKRMKDALEHRLVALTSPLDDVSGIRIEDLFNLEELQKIQDAFAAATGVASIITDPQGCPITGPSNFCDLCLNIIRRTEKGLANCCRSDALLGRMKTGGPTMQPCLSGGLWDGGAAIVVGDHHVANWLIGQVLDESCDMEGMMAYAREIGADEEAYRQALDRVTRMSQGQFAQVCQALYLIAGQLSNLAMQNVQQARYISERRQAEESLRHAKEYTENLIQGANAIIVGLDTTGCVTLLNRTAEEVCGYSFDELHGKNWFETMVPPDRFPGVLEEFNRHMASGITDTFENPIITKSGMKRTISWRNNTIVENGSVVGTISFGIDITEHRKLEEQLRQSLKLESIGRLAGGVAHDFNNKLTIILGYAEMSMGKLREGDKLWRNLNEISRAAQHSRDITRQLLAFSRQQVISPKPINLNSAIKDTLTTLGRLIGEDINLRFDPGADLWEVNIDPSQFDQIIMNLAINARDAMPEGGDLVITTANTAIAEAYCHEYPEAKAGEYVQLTVSDTGWGMDRETLKHIFEPFFTTKEVGKGTGLGLATVYGIISQNNGFINVYSEPGFGTLFKIFLPRLAGEVARESSDATEPSLGTGDILLVEDDETIRTMTTMMLEEMGYTVHPAGTPQEAIAFCEDTGIALDVILSDVIMPGMSGKEMMEKIELIRPGIKVLYMSGYSSDIISQRGVLEEDMHFIQKPFDMKVLNAKINDVLA